jgi:YihY family inner membrane protein
VLDRHAVISLARRTITAIRDAEASFLAAAVAYYAFVSLVPLLLLALAVATSLGGEAFARGVVDQTSALLTPSGQAVAMEALSTTSGRGGATVVGLLVLAWSGLKLFRGLNKAFAYVYAAETPGTLLDELRDAAVVLVTVGVGVVAVVAANAVVSLVPGPIADLVAPFSLIAVLIVVFLPLYYVLPDVELTVRQALPGTALVAIGWTVLGALYSWYVTSAANFALYGVLGGVLLLLTWLYVGAMLVIAGAVLNAVVAGVVIDGDDESATSTDENSDGKTEGEDASEDEPVSIGFDRQVQTAPVRGEKGRMSEDDNADASPPADDGEKTDEDGPESGETEPEPAADETGSEPDSRRGSGNHDEEDEVAEEAAALRADLEDLRAQLEGLEGEVDDVETEFADLEDEVDEFEDGIEDRTVHREEIERDLKQYVRKRVRRGHARGWGPYLVLLYGTAMTLGVFYFFQNSAGYAILAMLIIWLSTLGLYALMLLVGVVFNVLSLPSRAVDAVGSLRDR